MKIIKLSAAILVLTTILWAFSGCFKQIEFQRETPVDQFEWENNGIYISITEYKGSAQEVVVPDTIHNKAVNNVGATFNGNTTLESLVLPENCWAVLSDCTNLKKLKLKGAEIRQKEYHNIMHELPENLEILLLPEATKFEFSFLVNLHDLARLELPSAQIIVNNAYSSHKPCSPFNNGIKITIPEDLKYFLVVEDLYDNCYYWLSNQSNIPDDGYSLTVKECDKLTKENKAEYYCKVFGCDEVIVNGKTYAYNWRAEF